MERNMVWGSLALGILGWVCTLLLTGVGSAPDAGRAKTKEHATFVVARSFVGLAATLPFLVWMATLPTHAPFAPGQGWGRGFLLGGLGSLASFLVISRAGARPAPSFLAHRVAATAPLFVALIVVCVPLIWMRTSIIDTLAGAALGWVASTLVVLLGQSDPLSENEPEHSASSSNLEALLLVNGAAFTATLCAVVALGVYRDFVIEGVARGTFSAVAVALAGMVALATLASSLVSESLLGKPSASPTLRSAALAVSLLGTFVFPLGLGYLLGVKLLNDLTVIYVIGAGLVVGLLLLWLVWDEVSRSNNPQATDSITTGNTAMVSDATAARLAYVPIWGVIVALCGFMFAYQLMQGFGVGIMLLAAWPVSLLALPSSADNHALADANAAMGANARIGKVRSQAAHSVTLLLSLLVVLLLSRLFATRFHADLRGVGLSDQFALFGFVMGAALPALLASLCFAADRAHSARFSLPNSTSLSRLGVVGLLALSIPLAMVAVWGAKVAPAFFAGLALSIAGFYPLIANRRQPLSVALFSLAIGLTVAQWTHRLAPFAEMSRAQRLHILLWALGALVLLVLIVDYSSRIASGLRASKAKAASGTPSGTPTPGA